jgi:hypothetical protein
MDLEALGWRRSTIYQRPLVAKLGRVFSPIIYALNIEKRKYSRDVRMLLADKASRLSYQDAMIDFQNHTGVKVPKRTIHSFVQEIGKALGEVNQANISCEEPQVVMADGTKAHSIYPTMNQVRIIIGYDPDTRRKTLLHASVNHDWNQVEEKVNLENSILVSDAERSMYLNLDYERRQLDLVHAVKDSSTNYGLKAWANRKERR